MLDKNYPGFLASGWFMNTQLCHFRVSTQREQVMGSWRERYGQINTRGPFLESLGNFSGPKSNIQMEIKRITARLLASKLLHFVSLTDSFIMLDAKLLKPLSLMESETAYRAR